MMRRNLLHTRIDRCVWSYQLYDDEVCSGTSRVITKVYDATSHDEGVSY